MSRHTVVRLRARGERIVGFGRSVPGFDVVAAMSQRLIV